MDWLEQAELRWDLADGGGSYKPGYVAEGTFAALIGILEELRRYNDRVEADYERAERIADYQDQRRQP